MKVRVFPNYDMEEASVASAVGDFSESLTVQSSRDDADINVLVRRFGLTGVLPVVDMPPLTEEFDEVFDYQSAQNMILAAQKSFMAMPADVRARFGNDPAVFVAFCSDEKNLDEMRKLGLAVAKPEPPAESPPAAPGAS